MRTLWPFFGHFHKRLHAGFHCIAHLLHHLFWIEGRMWLLWSRDELEWKQEESGLVGAVGGSGADEGV